MKCLPQVYAPQLHPGILAVKAAGMKLQKCKSTESSLLLSAPNGYITSSSTQEHTKAIPILCQCWEWFYRTCKQPALLFSVRLNTMCCNKRKSKNRERKWELHSFGLPSHTLPFTLPALLPDSWDPQALNDGIPKRNYQALCEAIASMSKDDLPNTLPCFTSSSNISPLALQGSNLDIHTLLFPWLFQCISPCCEQSDTPPFHQSGLHCATSSSYMPTTALSPASISEHSCIPHLSSLTLSSGKWASPFLHVTVQNVVVDLFNLNSSAGFSVQCEVQM